MIEARTLEPEIVGDTGERNRGEDGSGHEPMSSVREAAERLTHAAARLRTFATDHPEAAVLAAFGGGYVFGRLLRRL